MTKESEEAQKPFELLKRRGWKWRLVYDPSFTSARKRAQKGHDVLDYLPSSRTVFFFLSTVMCASCVRQLDPLAASLGAPTLSSSFRETAVAGVTCALIRAANFATAGANDFGCQLWSPIVLLGAFSRQFHF